MSLSRPTLSEGIDVQPPAGPAVPALGDVLTPEALDFLARLQRMFSSERNRLLAARGERQQRIAAGEDLGFLSDTRGVQERSWTIAEAPADLRDRRVEITGPTDAKMMINALNSGASVYMSDFEDSNTPTFGNMISGQANLKKAVRGQLDFTAVDGRRYVVGDSPAVLMVRPRGWHLAEKHVLVDGVPMAASLFDFGLYMFHSAWAAVERATGPYFYLPKLESHLEARLWNEVFCAAQDALGIPRGTVRATVLIETIHAAFEMDEILYELRDHASGLNAGRWDYMFSIIKTFRDRGPEFLLPDRDTVTMTAPFMRAYTSLLVRTCHRRGAHAIGGMAAFIPSRTDPDKNAQALEKVAADKAREASEGFDGSWVAHPGLVPVCRAEFDAVLGERRNQLRQLAADQPVTSAADLLAVSKTPGSMTEGGLRSNLSVGVQYLASWLDGHGAVAINSLMEDVATAEIARSQIWQWTQAGAVLDSGAPVTPALVRRVLDEEVDKLGGEQRYDRARLLLEHVALDPGFVEFLTLPAYGQLP